MEDLTPLGHAWKRIDELEHERDELRAKLQVATEALKSIYTFGSNFTKSALEGIAVEALKKLEGE